MHAAAPVLVDLDRVDEAVEVLTAAFTADPMWVWALPDDTARAEQLRRLWRLFVLGAIRYPWTRLTAGGESISVWIPPGGSELTRQQEVELQELLASFPGDASPRVLRLFEVLENSHPQDEPHFHLGMLATRPSHAGRGLGLGLLAHDLALVDEQGAPAYVEASNPANVPLYERYGFRLTGWLLVGDGCPPIATLWRDGVAGHGRAGASR